MWYKDEGLDFLEGMKELRDDGSVMDMASIGVENDRLVELYVLHKTEVPIDGFDYDIGFIDVGDGSNSEVAGFFNVEVGLGDAGEAQQDVGEKAQEDYGVEAQDDVLVNVLVTVAYQKGKKSVSSKLSDDEGINSDEMNELDNEEDEESGGEEKEIFSSQRFKEHVRSHHAPGSLLRRPSSSFFLAISHLIERKPSSLTKTEPPSPLVLCCLSPSQDYRTSIAAGSAPSPGVASPSSDSTSQLEPPLRRLVQCRLRLS
ncbi:hypothetical protein PIB30_046604 [Stylosanthes scabra]|uniref:Uncharacterized protein n=1 Tax=Stylosanthes scabra TaxID=79078 RepID=A0ABU6SH48_9FABA|nr:hypothetical protein [Stylosanthes scabra]